MRFFSTPIWLVLACVVAGCDSGGSSNDSVTPQSSSSSSSSSSSGAGLSSSSSSSGGSGSASGSHYAGENCMSGGCHDGTSTAEAFTVGGTVYRSGGGANTNAEIRLYIHNTNTLSISLMTDASGNFYTTDAVDGLSDSSGQLVTGVDVEVHGNNGISTMPGLVTNGACNSCHGQSNGVIRAN